MRLGKQLLRQNRSTFLGFGLRPIRQQNEFLMTQTATPPTRSTLQIAELASQKLAAIYARLLSLAVLLTCGSVLGTAAWLNADTAGMGTHQQLGLAPCGFLVGTGLPCATCGMTTAFTHAAHGHLIQSFITQPAGMLLCLGLAIMTILSSYTLWVGVSLMPILKMLWQPRSFLYGGILIGVAWGYKIFMVIMES